MGWERTRFLVCAARGEGVRAHQHGVVLRLAVVGVVALAGLWLKLGGVHRTPATSQGRSVRSVHGRAQAGRHDPPLSNSSLALTRAGPAVFLGPAGQIAGQCEWVSTSGRPGGKCMAAGHALVIWVGASCGSLTCHGECNKSAARVGPQTCYIDSIAGIALWAVAPE